MILTQIPVGIIMADLDIRDPLRFWLYDKIHKPFGVMILCLVVVRMIQRASHAYPRYSVPIAPWQLAIAAIGFAVMYAFMISVPWTGWLHVNALGFSVDAYDFVTLPQLLEKSEPAADFWAEVHGWLALGFGALIAVHSAAALHHHFVKRDGVLERMWPFISQERGD